VPGRRIGEETNDRNLIMESAVDTKSFQRSQQRPNAVSPLFE
jgi:hypothetical protein